MELGIGREGESEGGGRASEENISILYYGKMSASERARRKERKSSSERELITGPCTYTHVLDLKSITGNMWTNKS